MNLCARHPRAWPMAHWLLPSSERNLGITGERIRRWDVYERSATEMLWSSFTPSGTRADTVSPRAGIISLNVCYYNKVLLKASPPGPQTAWKFLVIQKQPELNDELMGNKTTEVHRPVCDVLMYLVRSLRQRTLTDFQTSMTTSRYYRYCSEDTNNSTSSVYFPTGATDRKASMSSLG